MEYVLAYDLGTGGIKASVYDEMGRSRCSYLCAYPTYYPAPGFHEQRPEDWWGGICASTRSLLERSGIQPGQLRAAAISGHSLVAIPLDAHGQALLKQVPIWSDTRARKEAGEFFSRVPYETWYMTTGNGDAAETYSVMKLMWMRSHQPEVWSKTSVVLGSKDYMNYRLTGTMATDDSYASGTGVFDLAGLRYCEDFMAAADLPRSIFPELTDTHTCVGRVTRQAAEETGLPEGLPVICGGVDNALMALGAQGSEAGRVYTSLGSSAWIAVTSEKPVLDLRTRPFVFAFAKKGLYTSGVSIFAGGSAHRWARDMLCPDLAAREDCFARMDALAASSPFGANDVLFNPTLAGASPQEPGAALQGGFSGITLSTTRADLLRAVQEGVALSLGLYCLEPLKQLTPINGAMLITGGGAKSDFWMQIFADVFQMPICKSSIGQEATSLGAAAVAALGAGMITDLEDWNGCWGRGDHIHPLVENVQRSSALRRRFEIWTRGLADLHQQMSDELLRR